MNEDDLFRFLWLSRPLMQQVEELVRRGLEGTGLTVRMRAVLEVLQTGGPMSVPDLGRTLHIQRQYVQVMVNDVLSAGLAEKRANPRHRASPLIALTPEGQSIIEAVLEKERARVADLAGGFSEIDVATALAVTEQLVDQIGALNAK